MTVPVRPYRVKGGTNNVSLDVCPRMRKKVVFSHPHFLFDYKNVALFVLRAALPCLSPCTSQKCPMLTNSLFACHFASLWILFCFLKMFFYFTCNYFSLFILFIYFWLHWVSVAAHELSLVAASGVYSLLQCAGFSLWWLLLLQSMGSRCAGFSSYSTRAQ